MEGITQNRREALVEAREAGFYIDGGTLTDMVCDHDMISLEELDGVEGISRSLDVSLEEGVSVSQVPRRQYIYGSNLYIEKLSRSFWTFVWGALQDLRLIILMICAVNHISLSIVMEGWPMSVFNGLGIIFGIFLVVIVKAFINCKCLQSRDLNEGKNKTFVQVTRDGCKQMVSINALVVGDVVHLVTGEDVPADGIFIDGSKLFIDKSSMSGESDPVKVCHTNPFILSRTKVQHGHGRMLVASVGMRTKWGRLMQTTEQREGNKPMQVFYAINIREIKKVNVFYAILYCSVFIAIMVSIITFQVIIVQFLGTFASTVPLSWQLWFLSILKGFVCMVILVVFK